MTARACTALYTAEPICRVYYMTSPDIRRRAAGHTGSVTVTYDNDDSGAVALALVMGQ